MKRLINADELKSDILSKMYLAQKEYLHKSHIAHQIDIAPTVDAVEVVHGRWQNNANDYPECDKCGYMPQYDPMIDDIWYSPYCPNCGAKMDGDGNA
jgi:hypothetical protein